MRKGKIALSILCLVVGFLSCNKDDDGSDVTQIELRDRTEQQIADKDSIVKYLEGHYYNASAFVSNPDPSIADLIITTITDEIISSDADSLLINAVGEPKTVTFSDTVYEFYVLDLNPLAAGDSPKFSDQIRVNYEGFTLDDEIFDSAVTPVDFDLVSLVPGWRKVLPFFNGAETFMSENDGTVNYINHGVGVMFIPSGLAYFNNSVPGIASYTPIAFKFDLYQTFQNDHDNDGIPSYLEDLNGDGEFIANFEDITDTTDDDTDGDTLPNYFDNDDDGDGILTTNEITVTTHNKPTKAEVLAIAISLESNQELLNKIVEEENGSFTGTVITFTDTDNDGVYDYLDAE